MGNACQKPEWMAKAPLQIELVPSTSWGDNLRSKLPRSQWDRLRKACYANAGFRCELCGGKGRRHPVECHEIWSYDETDFVQKLEGLIALCPACHRCKHPGNTRRIGLGHLIEPHLMKVNGWAQEQAQHAQGWALMEWDARSAHQWTVDIDWLTEEKPWFNRGYTHG